MIYPHRASLVLAVSLALSACSRNSNDAGAFKDYAVNQPLPENQPVEITFTPTKAGPIRYACAMNMVSGELVAE